MHNLLLQRPSLRRKFRKKGASLEYISQFSSTVVFSGLPVWCQRESPSPLALRLGSNLISQVATYPLSSHKRGSDPVEWGIKGYVAARGSFETNQQRGAAGKMCAPAPRSSGFRAWAARRGARWHYCRPPGGESKVRSSGGAGRGRPISKRRAGDEHKDAQPPTRGIGVTVVTRAKNLTKNDPENRAKQGKEGENEVNCGYSFSSQGWRHACCQSITAIKRRRYGALAGSSAWPSC